MARRKLFSSAKERKSPSEVLTAKIERQDLRFGGCQYGTKSKRSTLTHDRRDTTLRPRASV